jgi:hypothetical protein
MNAPPVDPSSAAAKEPEAKPLVSDKYEYVTITDGAVTISGKQYNLSEIKAVSIQSGKWQLVVALCCLAASVWFYFAPSRSFHLHLPWMPDGDFSSVYSDFRFLFTWIPDGDFDFTPVYSNFGFLFMVFILWSSAASRLVFTLPTGNSVVSEGSDSRLKKIKAEVNRARIAAAPTAPAGPPDNSNRPG